MASKLEAARIASWSGVRTVIANAARPDVLAGAVAGEPASAPTFDAHRRKLGARKLWIAFAARVAGRVAVDDGARRALVERGTSLLAGRGGRRDGPLRRGRRGRRRRPRRRRRSPGAWCSSTPPTLREVAGRRTSDLPDGMAHEVIHRDDLVAPARLTPASRALRDQGDHRSGRDGPSEIVAPRPLQARRTRPGSSECCCASSTRVGEDGATAAADRRRGARSRVPATLRPPRYGGRPWPARQRRRRRWSAAADVSQRRIVGRSHAGRRGAQCRGGRRGHGDARPSVTASHEGACAEGGLDAPTRR